MYADIFLRMCHVYVEHYYPCTFRFLLDGDREETIGTSDRVVEVRIRDTERVCRRIFTEGAIGLGESYCEGLIDVADADYAEFLFIFVRIADHRRLLLQLPMTDMLRIMWVLFSPKKYFTKGVQPADINHHYSLQDWFHNEDDANRFYLMWLESPYIQYSCGKWDPDTRTLEEAQANKFAFYARRLGIDAASKGKKLLDLGCGWGGLMFFMAETYGIECTGWTLSTAQAAYVRSEIERRGLQDLVHVEIRNIHEAEGQYDYITSVGVMEHISDFDGLYARVASALKKDGKALIHTMFQRYRHQGSVDAFLAKYIFPGGAIPHLGRNIKTFSKYFSKVSPNFLPSGSYPKTLWCWFQRFCEREGAIRELLRDRSTCRDVDFAVRVFKHYLVLCYCGLSEEGIFVGNILAEH